MIAIDTRTVIELEEGLLHYADMSAEDVATAEAVVLAAGAVAAYTLNKSGAYVGFVNASGDAVAYFHDTRVTVTPRAAHLPADGEFGPTRPAIEGSEPGGIEVLLSGWTKAKSSPVSITYGAVCEIHWITKSKTGVCGSCE